MNIPDKITMNLNNKKIPTQFQMEPLEQTQYLKNGFHYWGGPVMKVYSPILTGGEPTYIGSYPLMDKKEALEILDAAVSAYGNGAGKWPLMSLLERCECVKAFIIQMEKEREKIVKLIMWEIGKSYADSCKEFDRTIEYLEETVKAATEQNKMSEDLKNEGGVIAKIKRAPLGVVLCMGPYNYPLNETLTILIPALLMGNTVVFKPPKIGVLLHQPLLKAYNEAFPKGVVNTVYGEGPVVITPIMESGKVDVLAFIGSSKVGDLLKRQHPHPHKLRGVLGMEAKNVGIVMSGADLSNAIKECVAGSLSFNGQRCTALKILFVHQDLMADFVERFAKAVDELKYGLPWEDGVSITPLPESGKIEYLNGLLTDAAVNKGDIRQYTEGNGGSRHLTFYGDVGKLVDRGVQIMNNNWGQVSDYPTIFRPAVVFPVNERMRLYHEEQFGPIVPIVPYEYEDEPLKYIRESKYGQQVSIFGDNKGLIQEMVNKLMNQVCRVNINCQCQRGPDSYPFTGRKDSAEGTLSITDALRVFSIRTMVAAKDSYINKRIIEGEK